MPRRRSLFVRSVVRESTRPKSRTERVTVFGAILLFLVANIVRVAGLLPDTLAILFSLVAPLVWLAVVGYWYHRSYRK
ncbi:hypothetical protein [Crossiella sp. CA198]|uniref:hypothetical protein n=1 Tax=Crossiella sp. CA198 TaxID=3455607 RepID=UPI003F8D547B